MIEKMEMMNQLLDFYESLLTDKQRSVAIDYYQEDLSLQEIADNQGVSKNAIYDGLKRTEQLLLDYENKLHLVQLNARFEDLVEKLVQCNHSDVNQILKQYQEDNNE